MSRKRTNSVEFKDIGLAPKAKEEYMDLEKLEVKMNFKVMTREEKIKEASRPLYLKRYE